MIKKPIDIIFLTSSMQIGGQEQYIAQQIINIDKSKFNPILCCLKTSGPFAERVAKAGIEIIMNFQRFKYDLFALWRFTKLLRNRRPHILYIFDFRNVLFIGRLAAKLAKIPLCVIASHKTNYNGTDRSYGFLDRILMPLTDHVIAAAHAQRKSLINKDGIKPQLITVIHNGIELSRLEKDLKYEIKRKDINISESAKIVGTVARLSQEKSIDILLKAGSMIIRKAPDTHFIIVGDGPERKNLEEKAIEIGIEKKVHFLGFNIRVSPIVKLFNVFTLSSTATETFSAATLEAMAMGIPVVVTDLGGMSEMVMNGVNGYLVPPFDPLTLSERIVELLKFPEKAKKMGEAAKQTVEVNFTAENEIREIESLFYRLLMKKYYGQLNI